MIAGHALLHAIRNGLSRAGCATYAALATYAWGESGKVDSDTCWPGTARLMQDTGYQKNAIKRTTGT